MEECGGNDAPQPPAQKAAQKATPKFVSLPSQYNLPDYSIYPQATAHTSTVQAEFERYRNGFPSDKDTDLVEFWSVSAF